MANEENTEIAWPEEFAELKSIEDSLICGICYEYMQTVVMTPCSHNYCSLCIRRYLNFKNECPACFNQVFDTDLRVNRTLDNIKQHFLKIRDNLKLCMKGLAIRPVLERPVVSESSTPVKSRVNQLVSTPRTGNKSPSGSRCEEISTPSRSNRVSQLVSSPQTPSRSGKAPEIDSSMPVGSIEKLLFSPSTSGIAPIFNPAKSKILYKKEDNGPTVPCPVCSVNVSETHINRHLDDCLKRQSNTSKPVMTEAKLKPIPKLVLNLMKDSELRRRLKEYGISTAGDSKALKIRLNRFHILYNAERDKAVQRSVVEIVKQCEDEENLEKRVVISNSGNVLAFNKPQVSKLVKGQEENYCEANKSSFDKLIQQVRSRNKAKKKVQTTDEEKIDLTSPNEDIVSEIATNVSNDSDSGTSSVLPRYSGNEENGEENARESCHENSEADSVLESNRIDDSSDAEINSNSPGRSEKRKPEEKVDLSFTSMIADESTDSENDVQHPVVNEKLPSKSISSESNFADFEKPETAKRSRFTVKKPRMSEIIFGHDHGISLTNIQALDEFLENKGDEEFKNVSLDVSNDSIDDFNASKVAENIEGTLETQMNEKTEENFLGFANGDKENEPLCAEVEKIVVQRPARKRGRPSRYLEEEGNTLKKSNLPLHDSKTLEVAPDESLDEVESSPEKVLKRRKGRPQSKEEPQVETPQRVLRRRIVGDSSK